MHRNFDENNPVIKANSVGISAVLLQQIDWKDQNIITYS